MAEHILTGVRSLAGEGIAIRHTLPSDYLLLAQKLEMLGFTYSNGRVAIIES